MREEEEEEEEEEVVEREGEGAMGDLLTGTSVMRKSASRGSACILRQRVRRNCISFRASGLAGCNPHR